ncbi:MAG: hypothetical protein IJ132_04800 [Firmicutes bacterium]|nr:hypothetical protein [Bacillota bacterium]
MGIKYRIDTLIYGVSYKTTTKTKDRYFRRFIEESNRKLAREVTEGWSREERNEEYAEIVVPYWKKFGIKPKQYWFELAGSRDRKMEAGYIPSDLYYMELLPYINNMPFHWATEDKNYLDLRFPDVKQAKIICRRIAGEYFDREMKNISEEEVLKICREQEGELFIKPSIYSAFGNGINHFDPSGCTDSQIKSYLDGAGYNCVIQEKILQHESLATLNPNAVNTIRVLSLFLEGKVYISLTYLRVGVKETSHVTVGDEWNAEILPDGHVHRRVWHDRGYWMDADAEDLFSHEFTVPCMDQICDIVRYLHPKVSHLKWLGWDFTIDKNGDPVLIEFNSGPGDHAQRVCGRPLFGEMTDLILNDYYNIRKIENFQARGTWTGSFDIRRYRE